MLILVVVHMQRRAAQRQTPPFRFRPKYSGMTTMERVAAVGLLKDFDAAVQSGDMETMVAILQQVELPLPEALAIGEAIIKDPAKYKSWPDLYPR